MIKEISIARATRLRDLTRHAAEPKRALNVDSVIKCLTAHGVTLNSIVRRTGLTKIQVGSAINALRRVGYCIKYKDKKYSIHPWKE